MNRLLTCTASIETAAGLALITMPSVSARLLLGGEISGAGIPIGRVAGCGLLSLGNPGTLAHCFLNRFSLEQNKKRNGL